MEDVITYIFRELSLLIEQTIIIYKKYYLDIYNI